MTEEEALEVVRKVASNERLPRSLTERRVLNAICTLLLAGRGDVSELRGAVGALGFVLKEDRSDD